MGLLTNIDRSPVNNLPQSLQGLAGLRVGPNAGPTPGAPVWAAPAPPVAAPPPALLTPPKNPNAELQLVTYNLGLTDDPDQRDSLGRRLNALLAAFPGLGPQPPDTRLNATPSLELPALANSVPVSALGAQGSNAPGAETAADDTGFSLANLSGNTVALLAAAGIVVAVAFFFVLKK